MERCARKCYYHNSELDTLFEGSAPSLNSLFQKPHLGCAHKTFPQDHCFTSPIELTPVRICPSLDRVIMVPPTRLLWVLGAGLDVEGVIRGPGLLFGGGQHGDDGETDSLHTEGRRPVISQYGQADVAVAVDVLVHGDCFSDEGYLGRVKWVLHPKLELQGELFALVERVWRAIQPDLPDPEVLRLSILDQLETFWGIKDEAAKLFLEPLQGRS